MSEIVIKYNWKKCNLPLISVISTRIGGVSLKPYHELNVSYHVGDDHKRVTENRKIFCKAIGIELDSLVLAQQAHSDKIMVVDESHAGCGVYDYESGLPNTDAIITNSNSIAIGILTADCVPVMLFDPIKKVIGVAHAGWKGSLLKIAEKTVLKMKEVYGTKPSDCLSALGPCIGKCCYEVSNNIIEQFKNSFGYESKNDENKLDLLQIIKMQLIDIGVKDISSMELCTACNLNLFYSHRAENGHTGRMISLLKLC